MSLRWRQPILGTLNTTVIIMVIIFFFITGNVQGDAIRVHHSHKQKNEVSYFKLPVPAFCFIRVVDNK
jgi:hypothetical protein